MLRMTCSTTLKPWIWQHAAWPRFTYEARALESLLGEARIQHDRVARKLKESGACAGALAQAFFVDEAIATAAIEGERLPADAVRSAVARRFGGQPAIDGLVEMLTDASLNVDRPLDHARLCRWQAALFPNGISGLQRIAVGRYRDHEEPMQIVSGRPGREVVHYQAPASRDVPAEMARFLEWFAATAPRSGVALTLEGPRLDGLARAAIAHFWFESIHPFEDGNGRVGRAVIDLAIGQHLRPRMRLISLSKQLLASRSAYYAALEGSRGGMDLTAWVQWFARQYTGACEAASRVIDTAIEKRRFWDAHAASALSERQRKVLQRLLDDGDGGFLGGLNAEKYMKMTGVSKATATRDLTDMVAAGQLRVHGAGKAARYYVEVPGWTHGIA